MALEDNLDIILPVCIPYLAIGVVVSCEILWVLRKLFSSARVCWLLCVVIVTFPLWIVVCLVVNSIYVYTLCTNKMAHNTLMEQTRLSVHPNTHRHPGYATDSRDEERYAVAPAMHAYDEELNEQLQLYQIFATMREDSYRLRPSSHPGEAWPTLIQHGTPVRYRYTDNQENVPYAVASAFRDSDDSDLDDAQVYVSDNSYEARSDEDNDVNIGTLRLPRIVLHLEPRLLMKYGDEVKCCICYKPARMKQKHKPLGLLKTKRDTCVTPCDHVFHQDCLTTCICNKKTCPLCRSAVNLGDCQILCQSNPSAVSCESSDEQEQTTATAMSDSEGEGDRAKSPETPLNPGLLLSNLDPVHQHGNTIRLLQNNTSRPSDISSSSISRRSSSVYVQSTLSANGDLYTGTADERLRSSSDEDHMLLETVVARGYLSTLV